MCPVLLHLAHLHAAASHTRERVLANRGWRWIPSQRVRPAHEHVVGRQGVAVGALCCWTDRRWLLWWGFTWLVKLPVRSHHVTGHTLAAVQSETM